MKILVAGATGFIGQHLVPYLANEHELMLLGRDNQTLKQHFPQSHCLNWSQLNKLEASDFSVVINLCGENIADKRWTEKQKEKIIASRIKPTETLCRWISHSPQATHLLNASAVGIYGLNTTKNTENSAIHLQTQCFSQKLVCDWEKATLGLNCTLLRFGVVLKKNYGILKKLETPYKLGMASALGNGKQLISWVHVEDLVRAIAYVIKYPKITGPVNIAAPQAITQKYFAQTLARSLNRPCFLKTPSFVIKLLFGQMGEELLLSGQEAIPQVLESSGFLFKYSHLQEAIKKEYD